MDTLFTPQEGQRSGDAWPVARGRTFPSTPSRHACPLKSNVPNLASTSRPWSNAGLDGPVMVVFSSGEFLSTSWEKHTTKHENVESAKQT